MSEREKQFRDRYEADALDLLISNVVAAIRRYDKTVSHVSHTPRILCMRCAIVAALPEWVDETLRKDARR